MKAALYARVSTSDKDQDPETQLRQLRQFAQTQGWEVADEFIDEASAVNLRGRVRWRELMAAASRRQVDLILCWKLDRCFRSVLDAASTIQDLRRWGVGFRSYTEPMIDIGSGSPYTEMVFNLLAVFAQFERGLISERTKAGMARAKANGTRTGRPIGRPRKRGVNPGPRQAA